MKKLFWLCLALVVMHSYTPAVMAEPSENLTGTWILDVPASQQSMLRARPFKNGDAFVMMPPMGLMFFRFDGDTLVTGSLPDVGDAVQFRRSSGASDKISYVSNHAPEEETILVSVVNENRIGITYPQIDKAW